MTVPILAVADDAKDAAAVVLRFFTTVLAGERRTADALELLSADFVDHDPAAGDSGPGGVVAKLDGLWAALPDGCYEPHIVIAAGELVSVRSQLVAGESRVDFADVYRVRGGRIAEHWHVVDTAALGALLAG